MSKRHHKRRAEQHVARRRRDELPQRFTIPAPAIIFIACSAVTAAILVTVGIFGTPSNGIAAFALFATLILAVLTFLHTLVTRVLPVSARRRRRAPGISERGIAPGVIPFWPVGGIDVHLDDSKNDH